MADHKDSNDKKFTSNQVSALLEEIKGEFRVVAEEVSSLSDSMEKVDNRLETLEKDMFEVKADFNTI